MMFRSRSYPIRLFTHPVLHVPIWLRYTLNPRLDRRATSEWQPKQLLLLFLDRCIMVYKDYRVDSRHPLQVLHTFNLMRGGWWWWVLWLVPVDLYQMLVRICWLIISFWFCFWHWLGNRKRRVRCKQREVIILSRGCGTGDDWELKEHFVDLECGLVKCDGKGCVERGG